MIQQRELIISGNSSDLTNFMNTLTANLKDNWSHDIEDENFWREQDPQELISLRTPPDDLLPEANIYLKPQNNGTEWKVTQVLPPLPTTGVIPVELRNMIITVFCEKFIRTQIESFNLSLTLSSEEITLETLVASGCLSQHNVDYLKAVAHATVAYASVFTAQDQNKFYDFVYSSFRDKQILSTDLLRALLQETFRVPEKAAIEVASQYDKLISFLQHCAEFDQQDKQR